MQVFTYAERPDLAARTSQAEDTLAEFMHHAQITDLYWPKLREELPELQLVLYDDERDLVVGRGQTIPASAGDGLPAGVDDLLERYFGGGPREQPDVLSALVAIVDRRRQGEGLSALLIEGMRRVAAAAGLASLIAPVRPTQAGVPTDPVRALRPLDSGRRPALGPVDPAPRPARAELLDICPASMRIEGTVADWEGWTGLAFAADGDYVVPGALVPVRFTGGTGVYLEPNIWMRHAV